MPISTTDLAKFEDYKTRQKTSSTNPISKNQNSQNEEDLPDLISWCVEDIARQMRDNNEEIAQKSKFEMEEIKTKIAIKIFNESISLVARDQAEIDLEFEKEINESESFEELIFKLVLYIQTFPEFGYKLTIYTLTTYIALCLKYKMQPNQEIKSIYQFFLEN